MTSEERIEKVSQLLMEGMTDEKKSKENYLKIAQLEVDNLSLIHISEPTRP